MSKDQFGHFLFRIFLIIINLDLFKINCFFFFYDDNKTKLDFILEYLSFIFGIRDICPKIISDI